MWPRGGRGEPQSRRRCGADVAGVSPSPDADVAHLQLVLKLEDLRLVHLPRGTGPAAPCSSATALPSAAVGALEGPRRAAVAHRPVARRMPITPRGRVRLFGHIRQYPMKLPNKRVSQPFAPGGCCRGGRTSASGGCASSSRMSDIGGDLTAKTPSALFRKPTRLLLQPVLRFRAPVAPPPPLRTSVCPAAASATAASSAATPCCTRHPRRTCASARAHAHAHARMHRQACAHTHARMRARLRV
jgi:hypothetical protein